MSVGYYLFRFVAVGCCQKGLSKLENVKLEKLFTKCVINYKNLSKKVKFANIVTVSCSCYNGFFSSNQTWKQLTIEARIHFLSLPFLTK